MRRLFGGWRLGLSYSGVVVATMLGSRLVRRRQHDAGGPCGHRLQGTCQQRGLGVAAGGRSPRPANAVAG
jgi:hypothetical protein